MNKSKIIISFLIIYISFFLNCNLQPFDLSMLNEINFNIEWNTLNELQEIIKESITYTKDYDKWKRFDYWQTPYLTWYYKTGDCEDRAILFSYILYQNGIKSIMRVSQYRLPDDSKNYHAEIFVSSENKVYLIPRERVFIKIVYTMDYYEMMKQSYYNSRFNIAVKYIVGD